MSRTTSVLMAVLVSGACMLAPAPSAQAGSSCGIGQPYSAPLNGYSSIEDGQRVTPYCGGGGGIPNRLMVAPNQVNMSAFTVKKGPSIYERRGQAWYVQRDRSGHGDTWWKLFDASGKRIASLFKDGRIGRK